jgi:hypothetical protein
LKNTNIKALHPVREQGFYVFLADVNSPLR